MLNALGAVWPGRVDLKDDYVASPKANSYQALHLSLELPELRGKEIEVQIRTQRMHENAEHGDAVHAAYKADALMAACDS